MVRCLLQMWLCGELQGTLELLGEYEVAIWADTITTVPELFAIGPSRNYDSNKSSARSYFNGSSLRLIQCQTTHSPYSAKTNSKIVLDSEDAHFSQAPKIMACAFK